MVHIFKDPEMEREFRQRGYIVRPLLDEYEVKTLNDLFLSSTAEVSSDYYVTAWSEDVPYRRHIYHGIKNVIQEKLKMLLPHYAICMGHFVTKAAKSKRGVVWMHQDWTFVDIEYHTAVHVWCPLLDVDTYNGCLKVVTGSHCFTPHIRATPANPSPYDALWEVLDTEFTTSVPMPAGSALIYDGRLLHSSGENLSERLRIASHCILVPEMVTPRLYSWNEHVPTVLDVYEVTEEFLLQYRSETFIAKPSPEGTTFVESIDYVVHPLCPDELEGLRQRQCELMDG